VREREREKKKGGRGEWGCCRQQGREVRGEKMEGEGVSQREREREQVLLCVGKKNPQKNPPQKKQRKGERGLHAITKKKAACTTLLVSTLLYSTPICNFLLDRKKTKNTTIHQ
jgi:hypothetical protein